jgi:hypothetical protein
MRVYYHNQLGKYYATIEDLEQVHCNGCNKVIEYQNSIILQRSFSKKAYHKYVWCDKCYKSHKKSTVDEFKIVQLATVIPARSILIFDLPICIQAARGNSVFLAADITDDNVEVEDRTIHANSETWEGAQISAQIDGRIKELDTPFKTKSLMVDYLQKLSASVPLLETIEKQMLELKDGDN